MAKLTELIAGWFRPRESDENEFYDEEPVQANDTPTQSVEQNPITQTPVADVRQPLMAAAPPYQAHAGSGDRRFDAGCLHPGAARAGRCAALRAARGEW